MSTDLTKFQPPPWTTETQPQRSSPSPPPGLFDVFRLRYQAWLAEEGTKAQGRIMACQQQMITQQQALDAARLHARTAQALAEIDAGVSLAAAELAAHRRLAELTLQVEEAEAELRLHRRLQQATPHVRREILNSELETEKLLAERAQLRRRTPAAPALPPSPAPAPALPAPSSPSTSTGPPPPALEVHVTDEEIERLAVRAVSRFSQLEPSEAGRQWERWRQDLARRFPPYAVQEVIRRAEELRGMLR